MYRDVSTVFTHLNRRRFCLLTAAAAPQLFAQSKPTLREEVATLDRPRILAAATQFLQQKPNPAVPHPRPNLFYSENPEFFPDPASSSAPYIHRPNSLNQSAFSANSDALLELSQLVPALTAAWFLTQDEKYAAHAIAHLQAWFLTPDTRINPDFSAAQTIPNIGPRRGLFMADAIHLTEISRAASHLYAAKAFTPADSKALTAWFAALLTWLTESQPGIVAREEKDHTASAWLLLTTELARHTHNDPLTSLCRKRFKNNALRQLNFDGTFPLELATPRPYLNSLYNLDLIATTCELLSTPFDNLWTYQLDDARGLVPSFDFHVPFIANKGLWPFKADAQDFKLLPIRHPGLLFAGRALAHPDYIALWKKLPADPTAPEILRRFPIRQPILWINKP